jgi:endonuclease/exonuclease/phosphatase family metal-dependent hydrolase
MVLRILTYNIHKGFTSTNREFVLDRIRQSIRLIDADLVFLQEVLGHHESARSHIRDWPTQRQFEFLAHEVWEHHAYGRNSVYTSGHHGNAILSKHPITRWENLDVSTYRLERRGLLHAVIQVPGGGARELHAVCLHLGLFEQGRRRQLGSLARRIQAMVPSGMPLVVAGDFNDWAENATPALERGLRLKEAYFELHGAHARTFPSWLPALKLDRIYLRDLRPLASRTLSGPPWTDLSDHAPLLAEASWDGESA